MLLLCNLVKFIIQTINNKVNIIINLLFYTIYSLYPNFIKKNDGRAWIVFPQLMRIHLYISKAFNFFWSLQLYWCQYTFSDKGVVIEPLFRIPKEHHKHSKRPWNISQKALKDTNLIHLINSVHKNLYLGSISEKIPIFLKKLIWPGTLRAQKKLKPLVPKGPVSLAGFRGILNYYRVCHF